MGQLDLRTIFNAENRLLDLRMSAEIIRGPEAPPRNNIRNLLPHDTVFMTRPSSRLLGGVAARYAWHRRSFAMEAWPTWA